MGKNILEVFEPCLMDHLGEVYSQNLEYRQNIAKEAQLAEGLEKNFTEEQMEQLKEYYGAVCSTTSICEFLAYRQGMRDLAAILGIESR